MPGLDGAGLRWGVEPMCAVLSEHGIKISPSTYYEWADKQPTKQQLRDDAITAVIAELRGRNKLNAGLGSHKVRIRLRGEGHDVARCTVERLMRAHGWEGARYGSKHKTTRSDDSHQRFPDLVERDFAPAAPNRLWVADFTYVPSWTGDGLRRVCHRRVRPTHHRLASRPLDDDRARARRARARDLHPRQRGGDRPDRPDCTFGRGVPIHVDCVHDPPRRCRRRPVGRLRRRRSGQRARRDDRRVIQERAVEHVEIETLNWVHWFNTERPHEYLDDLTPAAAEQLHYARRSALAEAG